MYPLDGWYELTLTQKHRRNKMSATPYELRAQLLQQAEGLLIHKHNQEIERIQFLLHEGHLNVKTVTYPEYPTTEEIIEEAEKLYRFVQTK